MNSKVKAGLGFGISMAIFYITYDLIFGTPDKSNQQVLKVVVSGIIGGAIAGLLFGWIIGKFSNSKFVTKTTQIETYPDEKIIFQTPANHFKGIEGVGGKLYLTNKRLVFQSHKLNIQKHQLSIDLPDIAQVSGYKVLGIVKRGLSVVTVQQKTEKFVIEKPDDWIKHLSEAKNELQH